MGWAIRIRREASEGDTVIGACYSPPNQGKEVDEVFPLQGKEVTVSQSLDIMENCCPWEGQAVDTSRD